MSIPLNRSQDDLRSLTLARAGDKKQKTVIRGTCRICMRSARLSSVSLDGVYEFAINSACMVNEVPQNEVASSFIIHVRQDYILSALA